MAKEVKQEPEKQPSALAGFLGRQVDGITDGLSSIIAQGSAEAASAIFLGSGYVMYGNALTSLDGGHSAEEPSHGLGSLHGKSDALSSLEPSDEQDKSKGMER